MQSDSRRGRRAWRAALSTVLGPDGPPLAAARLGRLEAGPDRRPGAGGPLPAGAAPAGLGARRTGSRPGLRGRRHRPRDDVFATLDALSSVGRLSTAATLPPAHRARVARARAHRPSPWARSVLRPPPPPEEFPAPRRGRRHTRDRDAAAVTHHYDVGNDVLRAGAGPDAGLLLRGLGRRGHRAGRRPGGQARPGLPQARPARPACGCSTSAAAGAAWRCTPRSGTGPTSSASPCPPSRPSWPGSGWPTPGSTGRITIRVQDYRDIDDGPFDAISSIGMAEHVGRAGMPGYAAALHDLLAPGGGCSTTPSPGRPGDTTWDDDTFIARYVFPDGELIGSARRSARSRRRVRDPGRRGAAAALRADPARLGGPPGEALGRGGGARRRGPGPRVAAVHGRGRAVVRGREAGRRPGAGPAPGRRARRRCAGTPGSEVLAGGKLRAAPAVTGGVPRTRSPACRPSADPCRREELLERRPADRPVRQDPAARGRPPAGHGVPDGDRAVRRAGALPRARAHLPAHAAGAVERPRRRARRRAGRRRAGALLPLPGAARAAGRRRRHDGPLRPADAGEQPGARPGAHVVRPRGARGGRPLEEGRPDARRPHRRRHDRRARLRARPAQAGAAQARLAGRGPRRLRRRRGAPDRARPGRLAPARLPAAGRRGLLGRRLGRRRPPLRRRARRWSARPRWPRRRRPR